MTEWTYGVAIESFAALLCRKARRRLTGRVIVRGMVNSKNHCGKLPPETMANDDIMFETQE
jgi:hypothetical protein